MLQGAVIIFSNNYDKTAHLRVWACLPYPSPPHQGAFESYMSEADLPINDFSSHTSFGEVLFGSLHLEMIYWRYSLEILPVAIRYQGIAGVRT